MANDGFWPVVSASLHCITSPVYYRHTAPINVAFYNKDIYHTMSLTVGVVITTHPQDELVNVSDSVNFTCEASGSLPINYRWLYNGSYIMNDPGHIEGVNTSTLMIVNVNVTDWGMYSCEASNTVDNATSNEAKLYGKCVCLYVCVCVCV